MYEPPGQTMKAAPVALPGAGKKGVIVGMSMSADPCAPGASFCQRRMEGWVAADVDSSPKAEDGCR